MKRKFFAKGGLKLLGLLASNFPLHLDNLDPLQIRDADPQFRSLNDVWHIAGSQTKQARCVGIGSDNVGAGNYRVLLLNSPRTFRSSRSQNPDGVNNCQVRLNCCLLYTSPSPRDS